jgi:hypothetical protein
MARTLLTADDCQLISQIKGLRTLNIFDSFQHRGLAVELRLLAKLPRLKTLYVNSDFMDEDSAKVIASMKLKRLFVRNFDPDFPRLKKIIEASGCEVTANQSFDTGFVPWKENSDLNE